MGWIDHNRRELLGLLDDRSMDVLCDAHPAELRAVLDSFDGPKSTDQPGIDLDAMRRFDATLQALLEILEPGIDWAGRGRQGAWDHVRRTQRQDQLAAWLEGWQP